jgi:hypothetical protein
LVLSSLPSVTHCTEALDQSGPIDRHSLLYSCVLRMAAYLCLTDNDFIFLRQKDDCAPKSPSQRLPVRVGCRLKLRQPRISSKRSNGAGSEDGSPHSVASTSRVDLMQLTGEPTPVLEHLNNDVTHRKSMIIRSNSLGSKDKGFSCRDLELALSSDVSLPSSSASNSGSVSFKSACPKIPPSINDSPHRSNSRRRAVSHGRTSVEGVRRPSSVRRFSRREPLSPLCASIDRGRQRSSRRLETEEDPRSLLELHLDLGYSRRSTGQSREKCPTPGRAGGYKGSSPSQNSCVSPQRRRPSGSDKGETTIEGTLQSLPDHAARRRSKGDVPSIGYLPFAPNL